MSATSELHDLGQFPAIEGLALEAPLVLWGRFGVRGRAREYGTSLFISVEDLEKQLGDPPSHRLELQFFETPATEVEAARLERGYLVHNRAQPRVYATLRAGERSVLLVEPAVGAPLTIEDGALGRQQLVGLVSSLANLLGELHAVDVHGVRFDRRYLRIEDGHCVLDGFSHLMVEAPRAPEQDVAALVAFVEELSNDAGLPLWQAGETPANIEVLLRLLEGSTDARPFVLPTNLPFVGRAEFLKSLRAGLSQAQIARPTTLVVQGTRGIGKSRLLTEFVSERLEADDALVLTGSWHTHSADTRSGLLGALEQLSRVLPRLDPDERDEIRRRINRATKHLGAIVARSAPALGSVLRHAEELPQLVELGGDFSRHTAVIADVLKSLGTRLRPLVLVLDNVETIDANSTAVLDIISQSRPAHHTLVVMGRRTNVAQRPLNVESEAISLVPLDSDEVLKLLSRTLPGSIAESESLANSLRAASDGLPLAIGANLRSWVETGRLSQGVDGVWRARRSLRGELDHEPTVGDLFQRRLGEADSFVQELALRLAVFGVEGSKKDLEDLKGDLEGDLEGALRDLIERGFLAETGSKYRFPHDTIRELVHESASPPARQAAHRHAADLLRSRGAPLSQIVYHHDLAFDADEATPEAFDKLSRLHVEAGRNRLDVYDLERARWHLEQALAHSHDPEQRGVAAEGLADICLLQEDLDTAVSLYTALIATAEPASGVRVAAKAVQFLFSKSANADARQLGLMALEMAREPTPTTPFGKFMLFISSLIRVWLGPPKKIDTDLREALCRLYPYMLFIVLIDDPISVPMYAARSSWIAKDLETGSAAIVLSLQAALMAVLGRPETADRIFSDASKIASRAKDAWAEGMVYHNWGGALMSADRYAEGQDRLDDAIAAFRDTGDVSISLLSMMSKGIYGCDREHADKVLGWLNEALTTARRNGKRIAVPPVQAIKLHVLARQGHGDLDDRFEALEYTLEHDEMPGIELLASRIHLAYAYLEISKYDYAVKHARMAVAQFGEIGGGVPEMCQEVHLVTALALLARSSGERSDRKLLRQSRRKFKKASKRLPRLRVLADLLELRFMLSIGKNGKAKVLGSKIVSEFEIHENLYAARQAHRALARLLKGENVLAAAKHEQVARNLGRRLGLLDNVLLSDFSEIGREVGVLALTEDPEIHVVQDGPADIPAAGMLSPSVTMASKPIPAVSGPETDNDVLEVWALMDADSAQTSIESVIESVQLAVSSSIAASILEFVCPTPELKVPFTPSDLEVLLVHMLLACRDSVGVAVRITARLEEVAVDATSEPGSGRTIPPGRYLLIEVNGEGRSDQVPRHLGVLELQEPRGAARWFPQCIDGTREGQAPGSSHARGPESAGCRAECSLDRSGSS